MLALELVACAKEKAYTVWNQKSGARASNYGSRVDFILAEGPNAHSSGATASSPAAGSKDASSSFAAADSPSSSSLPVATQQVM